MNLVPFGGWAPGGGRTKELFIDNKIEDGRDIRPLTADLMRVENTSSEDVEQVFDGTAELARVISFLVPKVCAE